MNDCTLRYSAATGANFIALRNGSSAFGKIILGWFANHVRRLNILFSIMLLSAIVTVRMQLPSTVAGIDKERKSLFIA
jgi:hypothetical protein